MSQTLRSVFLSGCLLDFVHDGFDLLADLGGVGLDQLGQLVDVALHGGAQFLCSGLQLGPEPLGLGLELLAQSLGLVLQDGGDVAQLLVGGVAGLLHVGLNVASHGLHVLGGTGLELAHVGGHSAVGGKRFRFHAKAQSPYKCKI